MNSPRSIAPVLAVVPLVASALSFAQASRHQTPLQQAWSILQAGANDKNPEKRAQAIRMLGLIPDNPHAALNAEKALEDEKPEVRLAAATALGEMHCEEATPRLEKALGDQDVGVVLAVAHSLVDLHDDAGYDVYDEILTGERKSTGGRLAKPSAVFRDPKKLGEFTLKQGVGFFWFTDVPFMTFRAMTKDDASPVRAAAVKILAEDPHPHASQALARAASDKSWMVRAAALAASAKRGDPLLLPVIVHNLGDENDLVHYAAAAAVIRLSAVQASAKDK